MGRRIICPFKEFEGAFIVLPDTWRGEHARRRDEAVESASTSGSATLTNFAVALALLDDWSIPGLNGNPAQWDFSQLDLRLIAWVIAATLPDFMQCFNVPKACSSPSETG